MKNIQVYLFFIIESGPPYSTDNSCLGCNWEETRVVYLTKDFNSKEESYETVSAGCDSAYMALLNT